MKGDDEPEPNASEPTSAPAAARWGFMSGFCGAGSMSFASRELGGAPVAGFDVDETVQRLWSRRTGIPCWGEFSSVLDAAADGLLDDLVGSILIYISGSPCPDFSSAGCGRGLLGETGSLWLDDCELGIRLRPPVIIREMVTGISTSTAARHSGQRSTGIEMPATPSGGRFGWLVATVTRPHAGAYSWWLFYPSVCAKE